MIQRKLVFLSLITFLVSSCKLTDAVNPDGTTTTTTGTTSSSNEDHSMHELASDYEWNSTDVVSVALNGSSASTTGKGITISGQKVKITAPGNYIFSGTLTNGQIEVDDETKGIVRVILNNVDITSSNSSPIYIKNAKKVIVVLADNSKNKLTDGTSYTFDDVTEQEPNATIFSKEDLSFFGNGALTVTGNFQDGIASKDGLIIKSGNITVNAKDDAIRGKDYVIVRNGTLNLTSVADAIKASEDTDANLGYLTIDNGNITISAGDDAFHAERVLTINNGNINITKSREGLEGRVITMNNGNVFVTASDDGVNAGDGTDSMGANANLIFNLNGGYLVVNANGDGLDSKGLINMTGGTAIVHGPSGNGNAALDYNGTFKMTGGILVAVGSSGMAQAPGTTSTQNAVLAGFTSAQSAGSLVRIQDDTGKDIITFKPVKAYQTIAYCSPTLVKGTYDLYLGGNSTGTNKDGIISGGTYSGGTKNASFTVSSIVTKVGNVR